VSLSLLPLWALFFLQPPSLAPPDARLDQALAALAAAAARFLDSAPRFGAHETLKQKAIVTPRQPSAPDGGNAPAAARSKDRQLLSAYALCGTLRSQALREVRVLYDIDGKTILAPEKAWGELKDAALVNVSRREELGAEFERESLGDTAVDFGQLLLLFQKANLSKYHFAVKETEMIGADQALAISFEQQSGVASLHLNEAGKKSRSPLEGEIWVRSADYLPLRIVLRADRDMKKVRIRDEARVDYELHQGALLPASVSHRRYLNDQLRAENVYQYSEWRTLETIPNLK
jgi:hypothetical protein